MEENKWNKFEEVPKIIYWLSIYFLFSFTFSTFHLYFLSLVFSLKFFGTKHSLIAHSYIELISEST